MTTLNCQTMLLAKIETLVLGFLSELMANGPPIVHRTLHVGSQCFRMLNTQKLIQLGSVCFLLSFANHSFQKRLSLLVHAIAKMWKALSFVHGCLIRRQHFSLRFVLLQACIQIDLRIIWFLRDLYYSNPRLFQNQRRSTRVLDQISSILACERKDLLVVWWPVVSMSPLLIQSSFGFF